MALPAPSSLCACLVQGGRQRASGELDDAGRQSQLLHELRLEPQQSLPFGSSFGPGYRTDLDAVIDGDLLGSDLALRRQLARIEHRLPSHFHEPYLRVGIQPFPQFTSHQRYVLHVHAALDEAIANTDFPERAALQRFEGCRYGIDVSPGQAQRNVGPRDRNRAAPCRGNIRYAAAPPVPAPSTRRGPRDWPAAGNRGAERAVEHVMEHFAVPAVEHG